eukprot:GFUD01053219.1.p1 GENE.GFUD01053219.1~~GFUD01053219.1.p1  ORF type:complete len:263 (-),score=79.77 GFUD01053219.1:8-796(-)
MQEEMENLFKLMNQETHRKLPEEEILRRIGESNVAECLRVLQESVSLGGKRFRNLEEKALQVMVRSYSYFNDTIWTDFAYKILGDEAFKKLSSAAGRAQPGWDKSPYGDEPDCACSLTDFGQLSCPSVQLDFKNILSWVEKEEICPERRNLVLAVFENSQRRTKASVLQWMKKKIEGWEIKDKEDEEEMKRMEEEFEMDRAMGIPFSCGIPGPYGERLDARWAELTDNVDGEDAQKKAERIKKLCEQYEAEDSDDEFQYGWY